MTPEPKPRRPSRFLNWWSDYGWFVWAGAVCLTFILGYIGFHQHFTGRGHRSIADLTYLSLQLFPLQSGAVSEPVPWALQIARITAPAVAVVGIVAAVTALYRAFRQEHWKLSRLRDHTIICGAGRRGSLLAVALAQGDVDDGAVIVIENGDHPEHLERCRQHGVLILSADATDSAVLERARIDRAKYLVALCGDDAVNARITVAAAVALKHRPNSKLQAHVHVADEELAELLKERHRRRNGEDAPLSSLGSLEFFDVFDVAAKKMLDMDPSLEPANWGVGDRLLVVGLGEFGMHLVVEAAGRFADRPFPLQVTILDRDAERKISQLQIAHEELAAHWSLHGWSDDLAGAEFDRGDYLGDREAQSVQAICICFDDEHLALTTTLRLEQRFPLVTIKVRMTQKDQGMATILPAAEKVFSFGLFEAACTPELLGLEEGTHAERS